MPATDIKIYYILHTNKIYSETSKQRYYNLTLNYLFVILGCLDLTKVNKILVEEKIFYKKNFTLVTAI